ncbi:MAG: putative hydro-lyase [SAR324 cluster bacterium]|nr:putative hydro-lyase [SAR324 cluster bacterium]
METLTSLRKAIKQNNFTSHTSGLCCGLAQVNVVILPFTYAQDFANFCSLNPTPCPLVYSSKPGEYVLEELGEIDIRTDLPAYNIYEKGILLKTVYDVLDWWKDDLVTFCIGCSFTFDEILRNAQISLPHLEKGLNVAMYKTNIALSPSRLFAGNMVVSMRWILPEQVDEVVEITKKIPNFHGAPVHIGNPQQIGINNLSSPDYGDYIPQLDGWVPVFWGCGVTPQASLAESKLPLVITHRPGCMLITNLTHHEIIQKTVNKEKI